MSVGLAVCAIARQETPYLLEWVAFQLLLGCEDILVYDNGHDDEGTRLLQELDRAGVITHVPWLRSFAHGPQVPAYDDALRRMRDRADWLLIVDLDEFVIPVKEDSLLPILAEAEVDGIWFPWLIFGSAGHRERTPGLVIERFLRRQWADEATVTPVKSVVRPTRTRAAGIHLHHLGEAYANPLGERGYLMNARGRRRRSSQLARGFERVRVHHYMTKSYEEWLGKVARRRADRGYADPERGRPADEFGQWDRNDEYDDTALRFVTPLVAEMRFLSTLIRRSA